MRTTIKMRCTSCSNLVPVYEESNCMVKLHYHKKILNEVCEGSDQEVRYERLTQMLRKKVFVFLTSLRDERYFRQQLFKWVKDSDVLVDGEHCHSLIQFLRHCIWMVNDKGRYCKYLYLNEYNQRIYIDNLFYIWAKATIRGIEQALEQYENHLRTEN